MLGGGDDYTFYLYEHKKEDAESEFNIVDIGLLEIRKFIGKKMLILLCGWTRVLI